MRTFLFSGILALALSACSDAPAPPPPAAAAAPAPETTAVQPAKKTLLPPQTLKGMYRTEGQLATFTDCSTGFRYRVVAALPKLDSLYRQACQPAPVPNESVYAELTGNLDTTRVEGFSGHGTFFVANVVALEAKTMFNICQPYHFWCIGTEPFWFLFISEKDGGFSFKLAGENRGRHFPWAAPKTREGTWTYETKDPATNEQLKAIVRREPCSDGMSERRYQYSVSLQIGNDRYRGCAVRHGDPVRREE